MLYQRGKAYSQDLRERVFAASDDGERVGEVAELLRVSVAYVSKALTRRRTTGETTARSRRGHKAPKLSPLYAAIRQHVAERGDTTIEELRAWLLATHQVAASVGLIWHTLKLLGLTLKKSRSGPPSRIGRTSRRLVRNGASASRRLIRAAELTLVVGFTQPGTGAERGHGARQTAPATRRYSASKRDERGRTENPAGIGQLDPRLSVRH
jgi:transposase